MNVPDILEIIERAQMAFMTQ